MAGIWRSRVKKGKDTGHPCRVEKQNTYMLFIVDCQKIKSNNNHTFQLEI